MGVHERKQAYKVCLSNLGRVLGAMGSNNLELLAGFLGGSGTTRPELSEYAEKALAFMSELVMLVKLERVPGEGKLPVRAMPAPYPEPDQVRLTEVPREPASGLFGVSMSLELLEALHQGKRERALRLGEDPAHFGLVLFGPQLVASSDSDKTGEEVQNG